MVLAWSFRYDDGDRPVAKCIAFIDAPVRGLTFLFVYYWHVSWPEQKGGGFSDRGMVNVATTLLAFVSRGHRLWLRAVRPALIWRGLVLQGRLRGR